MKIEKVELHAITVPLARPFKTWFGALESKSAILVSMTQGDVTGWGEVSAYKTPFYSYETINSAWGVISEHMIPQVLGGEFESGTGVQEALSGIRGWPLARTGMEEAAADLAARLDGVSLAEKYGAVSEVVPVGATLGMEKTVDELVKQAGKAIDAGFQRVKVHIAPEWDVEPVTALRSTFKDLVIWADAKGAYEDPLDEMWKKLVDLKVSIIEQPFPVNHWVRNMMLQKRLGIPVALSESIVDIGTLYMALETNACGAMNLKAPLVGGPSAAIKMLRTAYEAGLPVWYGGAIETDVGRANRLALAGRPGFTLPSDLGPTARYTEQTYSSPTVKMEDDGTIRIPREAGNGLTIDTERLGKLTSKVETFEL